jgi:transposase
MSVDVPEDLGLLSPQELMALVRRLVAENAGLSAESTRLGAENESLRERIAELERASARPAAPYSKNRRKEWRKRPGRRAGEGVFTNRQAPPMPETVEKVEIKDECCPHCGGMFDPPSTEIVTITDLPEAPPPLVVKAFEVEVRRCSKCRRATRAGHGDIAPDQRGATAHRIGPRAAAAGLALHYETGIPMRRVPQVLAQLTGLSVTQSALTQCAVKKAEGYVGVAYDELRSHIKDATVVCTDDTGWRVDGKPAFVMGFETHDTSVYQIRPQHRNEEVREVIPADYAGTLNTDRGASYDARELAAVKQNKCLAHLKRNVRQAMEGQKAASQTLGASLTIVFDEALKLWHLLKDGSITRAEYATRGKPLREELDHLLRPRRLRNAANQRLVNELGRHNCRGSLLRFLDDPAIEPTNNRAERMLRSIVISRKVSHCSKNERGAHATAAFKSVLRTAKLRELRGVEVLADLFRGAQPFANSS